VHEPAKFSNVFTEGLPKVLSRCPDHLVQDEQAEDFVVGCDNGRCVQ
jgi:hypothetical protein